MAAVSRIAHRRYVMTFQELIQAIIDLILAFFQHMFGSGS